MSKKICLLMICLMLFLTACGNGAQNETAQSEQSSTEALNTSKEDNTESDRDSVKTDSKVLVVYFSNTGNTERIAKTLAEITSADLYEIVPKQTYTADDLNYNNNDCRANKEQNDKSVRPEIDGKIANWKQYDTVLIGHPIWWGEEPRIMDTFAESYDFTDKTVTTFCTSGSNGIGNSGKNMEELAKGGTWLGGQRFSNGVSNDELTTWLSDLGIILK